jgi:hypothetical protein
VKLLVRSEDASAAEAVLTMPAEVEAGDVAGNALVDDEAEACPGCGSRDVAGVTPGRRLMFLSWLLIGIPFFPVLRRMQCRACGHRFRAKQPTR